MQRFVYGILAFVGSSILFAGSALAEIDWPGFRGPNTDGSVPGVTLSEDGTASLSIGWKRTLGSGYSALAVGDGKAIAMFAEGDGDFVAAFDLESGDELWRYRFADTYVGHDGSHDGPISTPLMAGGRVFGLGPYGHLFAVDAANGKPIWTRHLVEDFDSQKPHYGFTTSPVMADGVLVLEIGAGEGKTVAGFDPESGKEVWSVGNDEIGYHSPIVATLGGKLQIVAAGKSNLYGIEAKTGSVLWSYEHGGDERAMGGHTIVPVPAGEGRLFLMNKIDASTMLSVQRSDEAWKIEELWSSNSIKQSYVTPVYHDGHLYGMSNRIFTCLDASTGEIKWRSREPGDGFPIVVGDRLVVITKPGSLHVIEASAEGYNELASLELFDEHSWSEAAFAGGHLYARSMAHLARIDVGAAVDAAGGGASAWLASTSFGKFLEEIGTAADKQAKVEAFLAGQDSLPIVEDTGAVHFLYRGDATDVGIVGDMIGFRREDPMTRIEGTDLFYYSTRLEPDAAVVYGFIVDYAEPAADPGNPHTASGLFGDVSLLTMPAWEAPRHLDEAEPSRQGRLEDLEWESTVQEEPKQRAAKVYLPAGYDGDGERRYPVLYVHHGNAALDEGRFKHALDQLIGTAVQPMIAVFVLLDEENPRDDIGPMEKYGEMIATELVPAIDERYRTIAEPMARATVGAGSVGGNAALMAAFGQPGLFGRVGAQSATGVGRLGDMLKSAEEQPLVIYLEWGTYHMRSPHEAWDLAEANREVWGLLRDAGYRPAGGEVPEGYGWACWRAHTDELLAAMFPLRN
jgi:enterochelin esterase-like enzyme/outer membrane protein assembly factor BamB